MIHLGLPGIHDQFLTLDDVRKYVAGLVAAEGVGRKQNRDRRVALGWALIAARPHVGQGMWGAFLNGVDVNKKTAQKCVVEALANAGPEHQELVAIADRFHMRAPERANTGTAGTPETPNTSKTDAPTVRIGEVPRGTKAVESDWDDDVVVPNFAGVDADDGDLDEEPGEEPDEDLEQEDGDESFEERAEHDGADGDGGRALAGGGSTVAAGETAQPGAGRDRARDVQDAARKDRQEVAPFIQLTLESLYVQAAQRVSDAAGVVVSIADQIGRHAYTADELREVMNAIDTLERLGRKAVAA